jgi:hypothetical protein
MHDRGGSHGDMHLVCRASTAIVHIAMASIMRWRNRLIACW